MATDREPRAGSVRFWNAESQDWIAAQPGEAMFSTVTMVATEYYDGTRWVRIFDDDGEGDTPD